MTRIQKTCSLIKMNETRKERIHIPMKTQRRLLVECGHKCSVHLCNEKTALEFHHINGNPSDNNEPNLIVLCANHHAMAESGEIDRQACISYKERLKQAKPDETLKEKVEREGISVPPEDPITRAILYLGQKYMIWRYGKPNASIRREIVALFVLMCLCFAPFFYVLWFLRTQITITWSYISAASTILGAVLLIVLIVVVRRRCPNPRCHGYFGIHTIDCKEVDKRVLETQLETRITTIYRNTYQCVYCGYTYTKNEPITEVISKN